MIPAKITNLNPVQVTGYRLPKPNPNEFDDICDYWNEAYRQYLASKFIADVENIKEYTFQHGMITNTTIKKAIFLLNDTEDDNEVPILYENIEEIKLIKIK